MRKFGLILAGAALFDLGTIVASSHAAVAFTFAKIEIDAMHTADMCMMDGGEVVAVGGKSFCEFKAVSNANRFNTTVAVTAGSAKANGTKAPAKKEEAKKE